MHKHALMQIGRYLKATADKGLTMKPSEKLLKIDSFLDADFAEIYGHEAMCKLSYYVEVQITI